MTDFDKFYQWEKMAISSIISLMIRWFTYESVEFVTKQRHNVASGVWYDITIRKGNDQWSVEAQTTELLRERLIKFLDTQKIRDEYLTRTKYENRQDLSGAGS